ncbi:MAG: helix-turn-helix transcriptional regulator [Spirochaetaceae bacterium]|nr:MAG: helix-turn-helix transcriptional regulator [Spirochaetaceae bacterium]
MPEDKSSASFPALKYVVAGTVHVIIIILIITGKLFNIDNIVFIPLLIVSFVILFFLIRKFLSGTDRTAGALEPEAIKTSENNRDQKQPENPEKKPEKLAESNFPVSIIEYDLENRITYLNQDAKKLFGKEDCNVTRGISIYEGIDHDEKEKVKFNIDRLKNGETPGWSKYRLRSMDGKIVTALVRSSGVYENGRLVGIRSIIFEIDPGFQLILLPSVDFCNKYDISAREKEVIELFMKGFTYNVIAEKLFISYKTVDKHICNIYNKTGINSRGQLIELLER